MYTRLAVLLLFGALLLPLRSEHLSPNETETDAVSSGFPEQSSTDLLIQTSIPLSVDERTTDDDLSSSIQGKARQLTFYFTSFFE